jgi:hypothetical protein
VENFQTPLSFPFLQLKTLNKKKRKVILEVMVMMRMVIESVGMVSVGLQTMLLVREVVLEADQRKDHCPLVGKKQIKLNESVFSILYSLCIHVYSTVILTVFYTINYTF